MAGDCPDLESRTVGKICIHTNCRNTGIEIPHIWLYLLKYTNDTIKLLSVNGIKPTYENIQTGLYDIQTAYYAVIRKDDLNG